MIEFRTRACQASGHPEFSLAASEAFSVQADFLRNFFEFEVQKGRRFEAEETVQVGWMLILLKASAVGVLEVWEPEFDAFPIRWTKGTNNTLRHLIIQKNLCEIVGADLVFPSIRDAGVVSRGFAEAGDSFVMSRDRPEGRDSGWVFTAHNEKVAESDGEYRSVYELCLINPKVIPYMALPEGALVTVTGTEIEVAISGRCYSSQSHDFLQRLADSPSFV